jgi:hypothetical protein
MKEKKKLKSGLKFKIFQLKHKKILTRKKKKKNSKMKENNT